MLEFYTMFARKIFFRDFFGGGGKRNTLASHRLPHPHLEPLWLGPQASHQLNPALMLRISWTENFCCLENLAVTGKVDGRRGRGRQRLKYLNSLCTCWKDKVSRIELTGPQKTGNSSITWSLTSLRMTRHLKEEDKVSQKKTDSVTFVVVAIRIESYIRTMHLHFRVRYSLLKTIDVTELRSEKK